MSGQDKVEWRDEITLDLIEAYRREELLWNPSNPLFHNNLKKKDAWKRLSELFDCKEGDVKKKIDSLLASFRRERQKSKCYSGAGTEDVYKSNWFAFKHLQFLMDKFTPRKTIDSCSSVTLASPDEVLSDTFDDSQIENIVPEANGNTTEQVRESQRDVQPKPPITKSDKKRKREQDPRIDEAYSILKNSLQHQQARDESTVFGEHLANKHRKYDPQLRSIVEHKINNILFQADMGHYSHNYNQQVSQSPNESTSSYGSLYVQPSSSQTQFHTQTPLFNTPTSLQSPQNENNNYTQSEYEQPTLSIRTLINDFRAE